MYHKVGLLVGWLLCLGHGLWAQHPTVFLVGDATVATLPERYAPMAGWGPFLPLFLAEEVSVENRAQVGKSSRSFVEEGHWNQVVTNLQPGDYVLIQFGYNDQKKGYRSTDPHTTYAQFLSQYVRDTRTKGAIPILVTPVAQRKYDRRFELLPSHGQYPAAMRTLADSLNVPLLDLYEKSFAYLDELGYAATEPLFMWYAPGEAANFPQGIQHDTYLSETGARAMAQRWVEAVRESDASLKAYLKICEQVDTLKICQGDSLWVAGAYQTQTGTYRESLGYEATCERIKVVYLEVLASSVREQRITLCAGEQRRVGGQWQQRSGTYYDTLQNHLGCDSVVVTELIVQPTLAQPNVERMGSDMLRCDGFGKRYQWFLGDQPLPDTTATLTLRQAGTYRVQVLYQGCVSPRSEGYAYAPLPTSVAPSVNQFADFYAYRRTATHWTVHLPPHHASAVLYMHDSAGRIIARYPVSFVSHEVDLDFSALAEGMYTLSLVEGGKKKSVKVLWGG